jgi:hypothetical protein
VLKVNDSGLILAQPDTLELLQQWTDAKAEELHANLRRKQIEDQLAARTADCPPEGQKTYKFPHWRVVRVNKFNYRGDIAKLLPLARELEIEPPVSPKISESACKRLRAKDPTTWEILVSEGAVACQEGKPQFDISQIPT